MQGSDFYFIKLRHYGDRGERKLPLEAWGSYDDDFEKLDNVYTFEETLEEDHYNWGIIGYKGDKGLLVIDVDAYKITNFDPEKFSRPTTGVPIVRSVSEEREVPGFHFYCLIEQEGDVSEGPEWVDVKGEVANGHVVSLFDHGDGGRDDYELVHDTMFRPFTDVDEVIQSFSYDDKPLVSSRTQYPGSFDGDFDIPDEPPEELPLCLERSLEARASIPRDGTHPNPWKVDSAVGRRLVAFGFSKGEALSLLEEYAPRGSYDERESSYQMDMLYRKELTPESRQSLIQLGILQSNEYCECFICDKHDPGVEIASEIDEDWTDLSGHQIMQSIARTGKSYTLIGAASEEKHSEKRICYLGPTHNEARASFDKFVEHGLTDVVHLIGEQRAREEYDLSTSGEPDLRFSPRTPEEARQLPDECNQYRTLVVAAQNARVVVTVPELYEEIDNVDLLIVTEEAALKRMLASSIGIVDFKRLPYDDRFLNLQLLQYVSRCQNVIDEIDSLGAIDDTHRAIRRACQCVIDIKDIVQKWMPETFTRGSETWDILVHMVDQRLEELIIDDLNTSFSKVRTRIKNYNRLEEVLNVLYHSGTLCYDNENRKQMFLVGDTERLFVPVSEGTTVWTAGNSITTMRRFHELVHGDPPEPRGFMGGYTPVQDSVLILKLNDGRNKNHQSKIVENILAAMGKYTSPGKYAPLVVSGSSEKAAERAGEIQNVTYNDAQPLEVIRHWADVGMGLSIAENSKYAEGVDTPEFNMGALYNGKFATPLEDFIFEETGDYSLKASELARAAQNSILRPSDIPDGEGGIKGTGLTPVVVPSRHVPKGTFQMLETFGISIWEFDESRRVMRALIKFLDIDDEVGEYEGEVLPLEHIPAEFESFDELTGDS